jgi:hypothetical protein
VQPRWNNAIDDAPNFAKPSAYAKKLRTMSGEAPNHEQWRRSDDLIMQLDIITPYRARSRARVTP